MKNQEMDGSSTKNNNSKISTAEDRTPDENPRVSLESHALFRLFFPRSVALVGVSGQMTYGAASFMDALIQFGYLDRGRIYPINPKYAGEILQGHLCYDSLHGLPEPPDYVLYGLPAPKAPDILRQAVEVGAKFVVVFTSGFNELGSAEGGRLAQELLSILNSTENLDRYGRKKTRMVGPNCLGIYNPSGGLAFFRGQPKHAKGRVSVISQSGGQGELLIEFFSQRGYPARMCASIGNSLDIGLSEVLEFYGADPETEAVACYLEGLRAGEGPALISLIREIARRKPVVIWKTGRTREGIVAISSHTGALAGQAQVFEGAMRQAGALVAHSMEGVYDAVSALLLSSPHVFPVSGTSSQHGEGGAALRTLSGSRGKKALRVGFVGSGGGFSVDVMDSFGMRGIERAELSPTTRRKLEEILPAVNTFVMNPVDMGEQGYNPDVFRRVISTCAADENVDLLVVSRETERFPAFALWFGIPDIGAAYAEAMNAAMGTHGKPIFVIVMSLQTDQKSYSERIRFLKTLTAKRLPSFPTVERAAAATASVLRYVTCLEPRE